MSRVKYLLLPGLIACLLQAQNVRAGAMVGAYLNNDGWDTSVIDQFNAQTAKPIAIENLFTSFGQGWANLQIPTANILSRKAIPMITWMPTIATHPTDNLLGEITSGLWDASIDDAINNIKLWQAAYPATQQPTFLIRFAHEFNGNWYPWSNTPTQYIAAWRYVRNRFAQANVTGVEWVWSANNVDVDSYSNIAAYYPGNDVVDWTALDGYNWGSNYSFTQWSTFSQLFNVQYKKLVANWPSKPVMISEVASCEPSDIPNPSFGQNGNNSDATQSKSAWVKDMYATIPTKFPAIRAVAWFNSNKELNWALNYAGNTGLPAYNTGISNSFYTGTFTSLASAASQKKTVIQNKSAFKASNAAQNENAQGSSEDADDQAKLNQESAGFRSLSPSALQALRNVHVSGH